MFFSTYVLTKKGPLAKVWLAAHWDRRLTRHEVKVVDLNQTILHIVRPVVPIALRTSGELLVGVVRIYVLKVKHLLKEATEATLLLRVTTTTTAKGSHAGTEKAGEKDGASASGGIDAEKATTMDGVLLRGKGDAEAVTFNWSDEVAAKHGSMPDAAESLQGARFDAIADLLGAQQVSGLNQEDGLLAQAWYTVEPSSQAVEELHNTQQDYDEIAKMRADLMAFGDRASGSGSKSKSSLSSIEKGRGSVLPMGPGDEVPFPAVGEELDIGVPAPEDLASNMPLIGGTQGDLLSGGAGLPEDPFTIPDVLTGAAARPERKVRPVNVLDLAATTLPREVFEKYMADRSDVVCAEPRRGPLDEQEEADRYTIACDAHPADAAALARLSGQTSTATSAAHESAGAASLPLSNAALLSAQPNPTLRASFAFMLQQQVAEAVEEAAAVARASLSPMAGRRSDGALAGPHEEEEGGDVAAAAEAAEREAEMQRTARKRAREEAENDDPRSLSTNAVQTLQRIRAEALRVSRRKMRVEAMPEGLVGAGCTLSAVCKGLHRREHIQAACAGAPGGSEWGGGDSPPAVVGVGARLVMCDARILPSCMTSCVAPHRRTYNAFTITISTYELFFFSRLFIAALFDGLPALFYSLSLSLASCECSISAPPLFFFSLNTSCCAGFKDAVGSPFVCLYHFCVHRATFLRLT